MDNLRSFLETIYNVYLKLYKNATQSKNKKMLAISAIIYNYLISMSNEHNIIVKDLKLQDDIIMIPYFKYLEDNNIELFDFNNINESELNVSNKKDIERFVLTHVYYLTQKQ